MSAQASTRSDSQALSEHTLANRIQAQILRAEAEGKFEAMKWEPQGDGFAEEGDSE